MTIEDIPARTVELSPQLESSPKKGSGWRRLFKVFLLVFAFLVLTALGLFMLLIVIPGGPEIAMSRWKGADTLSVSSPGPVDSARVWKEIAALEKKVDKLTTQGPYLIVNTTENRFYLYSGRELIRQGPCSTGSNTKLISEKKEYRFKTPRGVHRVESKAKNPVWVKPDWAFIEEGLPVPPLSHPSRFDPYTLGDYKVEIGDDYMIHGTLYKRMIGMPVTHGCIRMLDEDIEAVYKTLPIGAKVIIY